MKLLNSQHVEHIGNISVGTMGPAGMLWHDDARTAASAGQLPVPVVEPHRGAAPSRCSANIIGERVLGLPKEPGNDRDKPFRALPR